MSEAPDLTIELFELLTKIDNRLTVIEARTDRIENIETALGQLTRKVDTMKSDIIELKTKTTDLEKNADFISNKYEELRGENSAQDNKIRQLQKDVLDIRDAENNTTELKEKILDLQCRSMRNNLVFTGLEESAEENTKQVLHKFIREELSIRKEIQLGTVHRFGQKDNNGRHRPISLGLFIFHRKTQKYSSPDAFREIETDILKFSTKCKYMCLNGDFNSRTSTDADFIPTDGNDISDILNLPEIAENDTYKFEIYNIPIARNNKDKTKNNYGKLLLDLCKFTNMYIINGRIGENMAGERTSKNAAVVDYFIGSLDFINIISNSKVLDFSCLYSDIHSPIDIDVDINKCTCEYGSVPINSMSGEKIKKWDINKKEDFILNLDREKISELENYLEETKSFPADSNIINKAVEKYYEHICYFCKEKHSEH
ncbi:Hypothetical predicted protein [Mytilus galloprovincialis]|uniref:Endonuclease/exonuclease/phosphatase domain-containing protein n=1 Tax=Mytilus galloprovincialis TaxID=29158 RepID=A0A8B6D8C8_MYTGA|nr:Hypothetical predicted protein [Mytilus galloprovincialis]